MAKIEKFEDIEAWQKARELTREIYRVTNRGTFTKDFGLCGQICLASVSIMPNIPEGFGRGGNREFIQVLCFAKGSALEFKAQLRGALDGGYLNHGSPGSYATLTAIQAVSFVDSPATSKLDTHNSQLQGTSTRGYSPCRHLN